MKKLLKKLLEKLRRHIAKWEAEADAARNAEQPAPSPAVQPPGASAGASSALLGLASCWHGANAAERMMNILSPRMPEATFRARLDWMLSKGCDTAHLILANGGDGEYAGYAAWHDADRAKMLQRLAAVRDAGLAVVPWIITDDSPALMRELVAAPGAILPKLEPFFAGVPYVVLGLEMDETGTSADWSSIRAALKRVYYGPIGVHHTSGCDFKFAAFGDIILGQLAPGCSEAQVRAQIIAILQRGKRAVGFEYSRGPNRSLCLAALAAGAEGVGNWDGGSVPASQEPGTRNQQPGTKNQEPGTRNQEPAPAGDDVAAALLSWSWGGFSGASAKTVPGARISSLRVTSSGLSYKWAAGGCEKLGAESATDYSHTLACLFCRIGGVWRGGKFDWISTSRTTRDLKNVRDSYGGWRHDAIEVADAYAFVIVSRDGKQRTNIIMETRK